MPLFTQAFDFFAYYPWTPPGKDMKTVLNCDNSKEIHFRILQDQAVGNMPYCNIMRAVVRDHVFDCHDQSTWTVNLRFEHIFSLVEFRIAREEGAWEADDDLVLERVVVLGESISTEGTFDIGGDTPGVKIIKNSTTSQSSIFKKHTVGSPPAYVPDANTGATTGGKRYQRRTVIVPPVPTTRDNYMPPVGEQAEVEFLIALKWKKKTEGEDAWRFTYRRYIAQGVTFESGKKYIFNMIVSKKDPPQHTLGIRAVQTMDWDDEYNPEIVFN